MYLTDKEIEHGFYHFFPDAPDRARTVVELSDYEGEKELIINCTQLDESYGRKDKKRILNEWSEFLKASPQSFTRLEFGTRQPQELFDAVCHQVNLTHLRIKWGSYSDISAIGNLRALEQLYIGSGARVESVDSISTLKALRGVYVENFQEIRDYSSFAALENLESLTICGDGLGPRYIKVDSIDFLREMPQLRYFRFLTVRLRSGDYTPVLELPNLEHLSLRSHRDVKKIFDALNALPKLKWGLLKTRPQNYEK